MLAKLLMAANPKARVELKPSVILMDINMPEINDSEVIHQIMCTHLEIVILIVTILDDDSLFSAMGAGEAIFSPCIAERLIHNFAAPSVKPPANPFPELTLHEHEILELISQDRPKMQLH